MEYSKNIDEFVRRWVCPHTGVPGFAGSMKRDLSRLCYEEARKAVEVVRQEIKEQEDSGRLRG